MSMLSLAGLVVSFRTMGIYFSFLLGEICLTPHLLLPQAFVISFSLGLGAIPWIIMSEVQFACRNIKPSFSSIVPVLYYPLVID
jgi:hypothetical protein